MEQRNSQFLPMVIGEKPYTATAVLDNIQSYQDISKLQLLKSQKNLTELYPGKPLRLSGVFPQPEVERTIQTISRSIEDLIIEEIKPVTLIPDYLNPTTAERPIIIRTPEGYFCIEGSNLIELAKADGKTSVSCEVDEINIHSDTELCLRKGGIRTLTRGGVCTYAELIRNCRDIMHLLLSESENLKIYGHGAKPFGDGFVNNREEDVRHILSIRLGRDRDTINFYISHGEFINNEVLQHLINSKAPKEFFVKIQAKKRIAIKNLKGKKHSGLEITAVISQFINEAFEKFVADREAGRSGKVSKTAAPQTENSNEPVDVDENTAAGDIEVEDEDTAAEDNISDIDPESITPEKIFRTYDGVSKRIAEDVAKGISIPKMKDRLEEEIQIILKILNMIKALSTAGD